MSYVKNKEDLHSQIFYLKVLSSQLERFKDRGNYIYNFRCPYCGDSIRNKYKARGYIYKNDDGLLSFKCFNCPEARSFSRFLREQSESLFSQYKLNTLNTSTTISPLAVKETMVNKNIAKSKCVPISELSRLHDAVKYLEGRKIPKDLYHKFFYTENFKEFCESIENYTDVPDDARVLLFETDSESNIKLVVARAIQKSTKKYIVLRLDEDYPKLYGFNDVSYSKPLYVVEGPIDSLFLKNAIATIDANLDCRELEGKADITYIHDNEPRSPIILSKINRFINAGKKVVVFDSKNPYKDINEMVMNGYDIMSYIKDRTFTGIRARLEFNKWKK